MTRNQWIAVACVATLILGAVAYAAYSMGNEAGIATGAAASVAIASAYAGRQRQAQRIQSAVDDGNKAANRIDKTVIETENIELMKIKAKTGDQMAKDIDKLGRS